MDSDSDVDIFWFENASFVAAYAVFASFVCLILAAVELRQQRSSATLPKLLGKALSLALGTTLLFALGWFVVSWRSSWLGGELLASIVVGLVWYGLLYALNTYWIRALALRFTRPALYEHLPAAVLVSPYVAFVVLLDMLGAAFHI